MNELKGRARQGGAVAGEEILIRDIWWHPVVAIKGVITAGPVSGISKRRLLICASVAGGGGGRLAARLEVLRRLRRSSRRRVKLWESSPSLCRWMMLLCRYTTHINTTIDKEQVSVAAQSLDAEYDTWGNIPAVKRASLPHFFPFPYICKIFLVTELISMARTFVGIWSLLL